jgi:hypothetical protein
MCLFSVASNCNAKAGFQESVTCHNFRNIDTASVFLLHQHIDFTRLP